MMHLKQVFIAAAAGLLSVAPLKAASGQVDFTEFKLDNGLHVILHRDNSTPIVTVAVMYNVGSKHEQPHRTGFAHFFEHLMFEGTKNIPRGQYAKFVERAGGTLNANTSSDRKSTRLNSSHVRISYAVFCLKKKRCKFH